MLSYKEALRRQAYWEKWFEFVAFVLGSVLLWMVFTDAAGRERETPWKRFVQVDGQPEPVPEQWLATPEGRFAHSIRLPNPVPKDSGYRRGMTSEQYFEHLCRTEAGEFIFKTVDDVEGFYFMRPPKRPRDIDLQSTYALEDPYTERYFQLREPDPRIRATKFVNPPRYGYRYIEEPSRSGYWRATEVKTPFIEMSGYVQDKAPMALIERASLRSRFGFTWRGVRRPGDREQDIAGSESIVIERSTGGVMAVLRNYVHTRSLRGTQGNVGWLNAVSCKSIPASYRDNLGQQLYGFISTVLKPIGTQ